MKISPVAIVVSAIVILIACNKSKFTTQPQLRIKSVSNSVVPINGSVTFTIEFTDKEGDVHDSLFVKKVRLNKTTTATIRDSFGYKIPAFPDSKKGDFILRLDYQNILSAITAPNIPGTNPPQKQPDTLLVKFYAKDTGGNKSDTVTSGQIIVIR